MLLEAPGFVYDRNASVDEPGMLVYENGKLVNWNTNHFFPQISINGLSASPSIILLPTGDYLVSRRMEGPVLQVVFTTLHRDYQVENQYLREFYNPRIFENFVITGREEREIASMTQVDIENYLALLEVTGTDFGAKSNTLFLIAIFSTCLFLFVYAWRFRIRSLVFLVLSVFVIFSIRVVRADDAVILTSALLLTLLFLISLHKTFRTRNVARVALNLLANRHHATIIILFLVMLALNDFYLFFLGITLGQTSFELDIGKSLDLSFQKGLQYVLLITSGLLLMVLNHHLLRLFSRYARALTIVALMGLLLVLGAWFLEQDHLIYATAGSLLLVSVNAKFSLSATVRRFSYPTFFYVLLLLSFASFVHTIAIYKNHERREIDQKTQFASTILNPEDFHLEAQLTTIADRLARDPNIRTRFLSPRLSQGTIKGFIKRNYFRDFLSNYDTFIHLFAGGGKSVNDAPNLHAKLSSLEPKAQKNGRLYFIKDWENQGRHQYVVHVVIEGASRVLGHVIVELTLKKVIPKTVFPALLVDQGSQELNFDHILFKGPELVYSRGQYSFDFVEDANEWERLLSAKEGIEREGFHLFARTEGQDRVIVISDLYPFRGMVANFSFQFLSLLAMLGLLFLSFRFFGGTFKLSLSNKIQLYLGGSFILPLLLVSAVILNLLNVSYQEEIVRNYQKRCTAVSENFYEELQSYRGNTMNKSDLFEDISAAGAFVRADINLYGPSGFVMLSSQPAIFERALASDRMNPAAFNAIEEKPERTQVFEEQIGGLSFRSVYRGVIDHRTGDLLGIISIPFFESKNHLNRQQLEVFGNLVIVFTIVFLSSVILGYFVLKSITFPITTISRKLRMTNLEGDNEPIAYEGEDEIGHLVAEYNQMILKLEASKAALAQSQKETAWKEIARQVAHEIKNPLTPMRLKIQQILRKLSEGDSNAGMLKSLISQIDSLSDIADSFSAFAQMPAPNNQPVDITALIQEVCDLYRTGEVEIKSSIAPGLYVFADPKILNRVLNNLVLNGIQSYETNAQISLNITLETEGEKIKLAVQDEGLGISDDLKHKIFSPYFSTKEKGSGIGLAIAKKGIEQAGGSIWFDSAKDCGTTFTILLPRFLP